MMTPGPWYFNDDFCEVEAYTEHGDTTLAKLINDEVLDDAEAAHANGRLMAAAPELIALLQRWVEQCSDFDGETLPADALTRNTVTAISRATGWDPADVLTNGIMREEIDETEEEIG